MTSNDSSTQFLHYCSMRQKIVIRKLSRNLLYYTKTKHLQQLVMMHQLNTERGEDVQTPITAPMRCH